MSRKPKELTGKRVNIYLHGEALKRADEIDNLSNFFQLALEQAAGIMAMDIIARQKGWDQTAPTKDAIKEFNKNNPLDPLTAKRKKICPEASAPKPELW